MCKSKESTNYNPETKENEYSLFYKPDKNAEEIREFKEKFEKLIERGKSDFSNFVFPSGFNMKKFCLEFKERVNFICSTFEGDADFSFITFREGASFQKATFKGEANFSNIHFMEDVILTEAKFKENADFSNSNFERGAVFSKTRFEGLTQFFNSRFEREINFKEAKFNEAGAFFNIYFNGELWFDKAQFIGNAIFQNSIFNKISNFKETVFSGEADFSNCTFGRLSKFIKAKFESTANFSNVKFKDGVNFSGTKFQGKFVFTNAEISGIVNFSDIYETEEKLISTFHGEVDFDRARFLNDRVSFEEITFEEKTSFSNALFDSSVKFTKVKFKEDAIFSGVTFRGCTDFLDVEFESSLDFAFSTSQATFKLFEKINPKVLERNFEKWKSKTEAKIEMCRFYSHYLEEKGDRENADIVFMIEKRLERSLKNKFLQWLEYILIDFTCKYGTNWKRPLIVWAILIGGLTFGFYFSNGIEGIHDWWNALYFSIVTVTTLGYGDFKPNPGMGRILASVGAVVGTYLWIILITVISRKYMRSI